MFMDDELERMGDEAVVTYIKVLLHHLPRMTTENQKI
jgi:hypothetical protein